MIEASAKVGITSVEWLTGCLLRGMCRQPAATALNRTVAWATHRLVMAQALALPHCAMFQRAVFVPSTAVLRGCAHVLLGHPVECVTRI